jgi:transcriptional regulator with XRE-family HTH domain
MKKESIETFKYSVGFTRNRVPLIKRLTTLRQLCKITQHQLSQRMKCSQSFLSHLESDKRGITTKTLEKYLNALEFSMVFVPTSLLSLLRIKNENS